MNPELKLKIKAEYKEGSMKIKTRICKNLTAHELIAVSIAMVESQIIEFAKENKEHSAVELAALFSGCFDMHVKNVGLSEKSLKLI